MALTNSTTAKINLSLVPGDVGLGSVTNNLQLTAANNLSDLNNTTTARTNLSLGTMATQAASAVAITGGTISNSATTATNLNTANAIIARDASGNFTAGTITAALTGTASGNLVSGGALGTPSSGTVTNLTGTASININGTVGATTASTGAFTSATINGLNIGYLNIPQVGSTKTASYTLAVGDVGKFVELGASGTIVVPASVFAAGDVVSIVNNTNSTIACTCSAITTVYKGGTDTDISSFSITTRGMATLFFVNATTAIVTGNLA